MNGYWGTSGPILIDEKILQEAVVEQLPQEQARRIAKEEGIHFSDVFKLRLEYRSEKMFLKITNLCQNVYWV